MPASPRQRGRSSVVPPSAGYCPAAGSARPRWHPPAWWSGSSTVVVGMLLRKASSQGVAVSFVVVASVVTAALLLGWRALAATRGLGRGRHRQGRAQTAERTVGELDVSAVQRGLLRIPAPDPDPTRPAVAVLPRVKRPSTVSYSSTGSPRPLSSTTIAIWSAVACAVSTMRVAPPCGDRVAHQVVHRQSQPAGPAQDGACRPRRRALRSRPCRRRACSPGPPGRAVPRSSIDLAVLDLRQLTRRQLTQRGDGRLDAALGAGQVRHHFGALLRRAARGFAGCRGRPASRSAGCATRGRRWRRNPVRLATNSWWRPGRRPTGCSIPTIALGEVLGFLDAVHRHDLVGTRLAEPPGLLGQPAQWSGGRAAQ